MENNEAEDPATAVPPEQLVLADDDFLAIIAHELRNPLFAMQTSVDVLERAGSDHKLLKDCIERMQRQIRFVSSLVEDLSDFSRVTLGTVNITRRPTDLRRVLYAASEVCSPLLHATGRTFELSAPDEPIWIDGDETRLIQAVSNLLSNAANHTAADCEIRAAAWQDAGSAFVSVDDRGSGIMPAHISQVFARHFRGPGAERAYPSGRGLGLPLVKLIADMHEGSVLARSDGRSFTSFLLQFPLLGHAVGSGATDTSTSPRTAQNKD
jgi:signal transduction histidine kinase